MLVERPQLVQGREVLEIGAGTGLCGIVAAKLGASKVFSCLVAPLSMGPEAVALAPSTSFSQALAGAGAHGFITIWQLRENGVRSQSMHGSCAEVLEALPAAERQLGVVKAPLMVTGGPHRL